jgi:hypothetical protein
MFTPSEWLIVAFLMLIPTICCYLAYKSGKEFDKN